MELKYKLHMYIELMFIYGNIPVDNSGYIFLQPGRNTYTYTN